MAQKTPSYVFSKENQGTKLRGNLKQKSTIIPKFCNVSLIASVQKNRPFLRGIPPLVYNSKVTANFTKQLKRITSGLSGTKQDFWLFTGHEKNVIGPHRMHELQTIHRSVCP